MTQRNPGLVFLLAVVTFGIYGIIWVVTTKEEMNASADAGVPTAWLIIVPFANFWWLWKFSGGVDKTTKGGMSGGFSFILLLLLGAIGMIFVQMALNKVARAPA